MTCTVNNFVFLCVAAHSERPKNVKMFLQPYAGEKDGRSIYKNKILPLFQTAGVGVDLTGDCVGVCACVCECIYYYYIKCKPEIKL